MNLSFELNIKHQEELTVTRLYSFLKCLVTYDCHDHNSECKYPCLHFAGYKFLTSWMDKKPRISGLCFIASA